MRFFSRSKKADGWLALNILPDGFCATRVLRHTDAKPEVLLATCKPARPSEAGELGKFVKDIHATSFQAITLLNPGEYQLLLIDAPNVPPNELKTAMRWRIKDLLDYHVDDATIDVLDLPPEKNATVRSHFMYAVAARNQLVKDRASLFEQAKMPLEVVDIPELAQRNIAVLLEPPGRGLAMLSFDNAGGLLTINFAGELYQARRIEVTLAQLAEADEQQRTALHDRITLELQRSLDHFDRQFHFITLAKLMLAPMPGQAELKSYLGSNLYVPVDTFELGDVFDLAKVPELKQVSRQPEYFLTLGAALRQEEKVL
jgi:MSHA biogenesis protein MshI